MFWRKCAENRRDWQGCTFNFNHSDVNLARGVLTLTPEALAITIERHREPDGLGHIVGVNMHLNFDTIREMLARLIDHDVPTGHQKKTIITLEEKSARVG